MPNKISSCFLKGNRILDKQKKDDNNHLFYSATNPKTTKRKFAKPSKYHIPKQPHLLMAQDFFGSRWSNFFLRYKES